MTENKTNVLKNNNLAKGQIHQVLGAVVDVKFATEKELPDILTALECNNNGKRLVWKLSNIWAIVLFAVLLWILPTVWCAD